MNTFESSYGGNSSRLDPGSILECGVCWWIYDPAQGDETWQVPPGTAFAALPSHWRCPNCDTAQEQFMVVEQAADQNHKSHPRPRQPAGLAHLREREQQLLQAYSAVSERMRELPVYNERLDIRVVGLRRWEQGLLGVIVTPWCMNLALLPTDAAPAPVEGTKRELAFPSGCYPFIAGQLAGIGPLESCSLFSPMDEFDDPEVAEQVAGYVLEELLREPANPVTPGISRRNFLRGGSDRSRDKPPA